MPRRRISRLFFEVLFLVAVAAVVTTAHMRPLAVIVLMLLAWLVVALFEWTAWLDQPHYGSGLPPRYYVPQIALPPARPVEQHPYPGHHRVEDEQTWIVSPEDWAAALDEWPVLDSSPAGEDTEIAVAGVETEPEPEYPPEIQHTAARSDTPLVDDGAPVDDGGPVDDTSVVEAVSDATSVSIPAHEAEAASQPPPDRSAPLVELPHVVAAGVARHHVDPLEPARRDRLRWARARADGGGVIELPDRPPADRALPGVAERPDRPAAP